MSQTFCNQSDSCQAHNITHCFRFYHNTAQVMQVGEQDCDAGVELFNSMHKTYALNDSCSHHIIGSMGHPGSYDDERNTCHSVHMSNAYH